MSRAFRGAGARQFTKRRSRWSAGANCRRCKPCADRPPSSATLLI